MKMCLRAAPLLFGAIATVASDLVAQGSTVGPKTRAELSNYTETSSHADVVAFVDSLKKLRAPIVVQQLGTSTAGRRLPFVIASRPQVSTPAEARRLGRPIVYVQANIHGGEVEGKEAVQALLRDWSFGKSPNVLDSLVVIVIPIYNADGNDSLGAQARNRGAQNGPESIGLRPNGMGLDLNRDYIKAEAPETRASLAAFNAWDPDVMMDLHTTNGSYHGYALTYSQSLHPAAPLAPYVIDTLLVEIRNRMKVRHGFEIYPYGNFVGEGRDSFTSTDKAGWWTYEHKQRFGTNYYGLRGRISILSEAYSHDPFERRVASTRAFVQEILSYVAANGREIRERIAAGTAATTFANARSISVPISAKFAEPDTQTVLVEAIERASDSTVLSEPGMRRGFVRTGRMEAKRMPVVDRFAGVIFQRPPHGYVLEGVSDSIVQHLRLHGVSVERLDRDVQSSVETFTIDSVTFGRPFQGHREATVTGRWQPSSRVVKAGSYLVRMGTPLDLLAMQLLEPQSDDGLVTWNAFDAFLGSGKVFPVYRLTQALR